MLAQLLNSCSRPERQITAVTRGRLGRISHLDLTSIDRRGNDLRDGRCLFLRQLEPVSEALVGRRLVHHVLKAAMLIT